MPVILFTQHWPVYYVQIFIYKPTTNSESGHIVLLIDGWLFIFSMLDQRPFSASFKSLIFLFPGLALHSFQSSTLCFHHIQTFYKEGLDLLDLSLLTPSRAQATDNFLPMSSVLGKPQVIVFLLCPILLTSSSQHLRQVFLGLPVFLFPCGFHCSALLVMFPDPFLNVCPIQIHFLFFSWFIGGIWFVCSHSTWLLMQFGHHIPNILLRHLPMEA